MSKVLISEARYEELLDTKVWRELNRDHGYIFAATADEQTEAEERITDRCDRELGQKYEVGQ